MSSILRKQKIIAKPLKAGYPIDPQTIGEHIKKKRLDCKRSQQDVAQEIGVSTDCITYWENARNVPQIKHYPMIISFLGYFPIEVNQSTLAGRIFAYRCMHGLSAKKLGNLIGIEGCKVLAIERNQSIPNKITMAKIRNLIDVL